MPSEVQRRTEHLQYYFGRQSYQKKEGCKHLMRRVHFQAEIVNKESLSHSRFPCLQIRP